MATTGRHAPVSIRVVKISPGERACWWPECIKERYICMGWEKVGDLSKFYSLEELIAAMRRKRYPNSPSTASKKAGELWTLRGLQKDDKVIANRGIAELLAVGIVRRPGYQYRSQAKYGHTVTVDWDTSYAQRIPRQETWNNNTVADVPRNLVRRLFGNLADKAEVITAADYEKEREYREKSVALRTGQPKFRQELIGAYGGRCAISGWNGLDALEAAHIRHIPHRDLNHPSNGILLRADLHLLFDRELLKVDSKTLTVRLDPTLRDTKYWTYEGRRLHLPKQAIDRPSKEFLARRDG